MIKVLVNGALGKMGQQVVSSMKGEQGLTLVGQSDKDDKIEDKIWFSNPDVVVDFTHPSCVKDNVSRILKSECNAVVGTTGLTEEDLKDLSALAEKKNLGLIICPNFAIGAVLMMKCASEIAKYMSTVEIIELHHDKKADAPSGTALKTADMIYNQNHSINSGFKSTKTTEILPGARGGVRHSISIHSIRLPGLVAHQEVIFGGLGQTVTIRHDSISRESFMPGVMMCIRKVVSIKGLVFGLENLL